MLCQRFKHYNMQWCTRSPHKRAPNVDELNFTPTSSIAADRRHRHNPLHATLASQREMKQQQQYLEDPEEEKLPLIGEEEDLTYNAISIAPPPRRLDLICRR
jgi:hypothetical protein